MGFAGWAATRLEWVGWLWPCFSTSGTCGFWICLVLCPVLSEKELGGGDVVAYVPGVLALV